MSKRASSSTDAPSKKQRTRVYSSSQAGPSTTRATRYTELRYDGRGRLRQRRTTQHLNVPLVPNHLDPDKEIDEWVDDTDPAEDTAATKVGDASASKRHPKKKTQTRLVCFMFMTRVHFTEFIYRRTSPIGFLFAIRFSMNCFVMMAAEIP
jgi:hypothetical protein